jgi:hypothetical protein
VFRVIPGDSVDETFLAATQSNSIAPCPARSSKSRERRQPRQKQRRSEILGLPVPARRWQEKCARATTRGVMTARTEWSVPPKLASQREQPPRRPSASLEQLRLAHICISTNIQHGVGVWLFFFFFFHPGSKNERALLYFRGWFLHFERRGHSRRPRMGLALTTARANENGFLLRASQEEATTITRRQWMI